MGRTAISVKDPPQTELLTVQGVGRWLGVSERTIYYLCKNGEIPCARVANRLMIPREALVAWVAEQNEHALRPVQVRAPQK